MSNLASNKSRIPIRSPNTTPTRGSKQGSELPSKVSSTLKLTPLLGSPKSKSLKSSPNENVKTHCPAVSKRDLKDVLVPLKSKVKPWRNPEVDNNDNNLEVGLVEKPPETLTISQVLETYNPDWNSRDVGAAPINLLSDKLLKLVFSYLNHADLVQCTAVNRYWYRLITTDSSYLDRTVCVISIRKFYDAMLNHTSYTDITANARVPFRHARMQFVDNRFLENPTSFYYKGSDNDLYFRQNERPAPKFLESLVSLEFRSCFLLWHTVLRILTKAVQLEYLIFTNCVVSNFAPPPKKTSDYELEDEYNGGNAVFSLKNLEILEARQLKEITTILKRFVCYKNQSLVSLKITYQPPEKPKTLVDTDEDSQEFCSKLKELITLCANSLQVLVLNIHHEPTLDLIGDQISQALVSLGPRMNLKEYQLTLSLGCWEGKPELSPKANASIKMNNFGQTPEDSQESLKAAAISVARFLESQKNLEKLGVPCISYPIIYSREFKINFAKLPCADKLSFLSVPCPDFLLPEFLDQFPKLRRIKVGGACCDDYTSGWEIFKLYLKAKEQSPSDRRPALMHIQKDFFDGMQQRNLRSSENLALTSTENQQQSPSANNHINVMGRLKELCISSSSLPSDFALLTENLSGLTLLEISSATPIFNDDHLQACIKHLKQLRTLMIGCADLLTDYGITGIPEDLCMTMFKVQRYHKYGINLNIWSIRKLEGRPLSDIKGLRKLVLIGNCKFTDIGIGFGIAFKELKYCHLPYSDYLMEWGIRRFGEMNPSVETFIMSGVNQHCKEAFLNLRKTHERLKRGDRIRSGYFVEKESPIRDDFSLILPPPPACLAQWYANVSGKISGFVSTFFK